MELPYNVKQLSHYRNAYSKFHLNEYVTKFIIPDNVGFDENILENILKTLIDQALEHSKKDGIISDYVSVVLMNPTLEYLITSGLWRANQNVALVLIEEINRLEISDKKVDFLSQQISAVVTTCNLPRGRGGDKRVNLLAAKDRSERSFVKIANTDNKCLFYACEVGRLHYDPKIGKKPGNHPSDFITYNRWSYIKSAVDLQKPYAEELFKQLGAPELFSYGLDHVQAVQNFYDEKYPGLFRIIVVRDEDGPEILFKGPMEREYTIVLLHEQDHFDLILNLPLFFYGKRMNYCYECAHTYVHRTQHKRSCPAKCSKCCRVGQGPCPRNTTCVKCESCKKEFFNTECFTLHLKRACKFFARCEDCNADYRRDQPHKCYETYCHACHQKHQKGACYIQPLDPKPNKTSRIICFDFETTQDLVVKEGSFQHAVNYISAQWTCTRCADNNQAFGPSNCDVCRPNYIDREFEEKYDSLNEPGPKCAKYELPTSSTHVTKEEFKKQTFFERKLSWSMYTSTDPLKDFLEWLLKSFSKDYPCICYSHNGSRFDEHLLLKTLYNEYKLAPELLQNGNKIFQMKVQLDNKHANLIFRDSYLLMLAPLAELPEIFGLDCENKRYFPHLFNTLKNKDVELSNLPAVEMYLPDSMKPEKNEKFLQWYEQNRHTPFSLRKELCEYGDLDTEILLKAVVEYRRIILDITKGVDVFLLSKTIASLAMNIFRLMFLKKNQFGIVPERGYEALDIASDKAIKYLEWRAVKENIFIQHAGNIGEYKVGQYKIDGYIESENLGIEFLGCYVHGCKKCLKDDTKCINGKDASTNYNLTMERVEQIQQSYGLKIELVWECEVDELLSIDKEMRDFFSDLNTKGRIEPRDAFMGGLTMPFKMLEAADENTEISYFDIISLYPYINFMGPYPLGHPEIFCPEHDEQIVDWRKPEDIIFRGSPIRGLVKVRVLAPKGLYIPVLPKRLDDSGRLLLALCHACAKDFENKPNKVFEQTFCPHDDEQRSFTTTTTTVELEAALRKGYIVSRFYRAYHYARWTDSPGESNPFRDYVTTFLKYKVENSNFPSGVDTDEKKKAFAEGYKTFMGVDIDISQVSLNPGFRHIAKILLNSLWGKLAQRNDQVHSVVFTSKKSSLAKYFELLRNYDKYDIRDIIKINQNVVRVVYRDRKPLIKENDTSNPIIAIYTTGPARLRLQGYLDTVVDKGCVPLYTDTDSIMLRHPKGMCPLIEGIYLGEMSREYARYRIVRYAAAGAKQWGLLLEDADGNLQDKVKIRGITLDSRNVEKFRFEAFEEMVRKFGSADAGSVKTQYPQIRPSKFGTVETRFVEKVYACVNTKMLVADDWVCYPFGFK